MTSAIAASLLKRSKFTAIVLALLASGCTSETGAETEDSASMAAEAQTASAADAKPIPAIHLSPAFPKLTFSRPVFFTHAGDGTNRVFVVEQTGRILTFDNNEDVTQADVFLDIKDRVRTRHNEEGLLSLVFHPKYKDNGTFYIYYTTSDPKRNRIARFQVMKDNPAKADPASEQVLLEVEQKYGNHNGSTLLFGPDGYLYASFGDGGLANDPDDNGQNLRTLLGKIIRIDVDHPDSGKLYGVPKDNPFVDRADARSEIWAYGLRNVWRMSFDRATGELWAGDVGQNSWEEIDLIIKGGNYGWNIREGKHPFKTPVNKPLIEPVLDYSHRDGLSITGGYVYRGKRNPRLDGVYLYADYASKRIWGIRWEGGKVTAKRELVKPAESAFVTSFGEDQGGELIVCAFDKLDGRDGRLFRIVEN